MQKLPKDFFQVSAAAKKAASHPSCGAKWWILTAQCDKLAMVVS